MALVLIPEDGTGLANANSYATVEQGDAYHDAHLYATAWTGATPENKAKALAMATRTINNAMEWKGYRKGSEQALEWPRTYVNRPDIDGRTILHHHLHGAYWDENRVPQPIIDATIDLARTLLEGDRTADDSTKGIKSLKLGQGAIGVDFDPTDRKYVLPDEVLRMLAQFGTARGKRGTAPITRVQ
jgi:hypothetical protein